MMSYRTTSHLCGMCGRHLLDVGPLGGLFCRECDRGRCPECNLRLTDRDWQRCPRCRTDTTLASMLKPRP